MNDCAFCQRLFEQRIIEEGKTVVVFLSNPRLEYGHLLVVPKRHTNKFSELTEEEILEVNKFLAKYQEKVLEKLSMGTVIQTNYKPYKPNSRFRVNHFHFHILPINKGDEYEIGVDEKKASIYKDLTDEEEKKLKKILK